MYFVVLWKNIEFSLLEIEDLNIYNKEKSWDILFFDTDYPDLLSDLAWVVKFWRVIEKSEIINYTKWKLVWTNDNDFAKELKKLYSIKRFKIVDIWKSDLEIKNKWLEIIKYKDKYLLVEWYQNVDVYSYIDFDKQVSWMQVWMMPSKLAHIMINIWKNNTNYKDNNLTIYDPFVGFWTTWFLANFLWYNFIGSDINVTSAKQNLNWWKSTNYYNSNSMFTLFKHDVKNPFNKNFLKKVDLIVTEWWLWPVINRRASENELSNNQKTISNLYIQFLSNVLDFWSEINLVITLPYYIWYSKNILESEISNFLFLKWINFKFLDTVYHRKNQLVWRKVLVLKK